MEIKIENLGCGYDNRQLFQDVSFSLRNGDVLTVLGVNGAGKTTLVRCIMQFVSNYEGTVSVDGTPIRNIPIRRRAKIIGYVAPDDISDLDITVLDYISLGLASQIDYFSCPSDEQYRFVKNLCAEYDFKGFLDRKIKHLSQGERQMVSVLRVLAQNPDIVVFDEPTASLDLKNQKDLIALVVHLRKQGKIVIQISHNPNHALQVGGKALLLFSDKTVYGDVEDIVNSKSLSELYGTDIYIEEVKGKKLIFA
jgi:iron complex transport system ATP-binding protein